MTDFLSASVHSPPPCTFYLATAQPTDCHPGGTARVVVAHGGGERPGACMHPGSRWPTGTVDPHGTCPRPRRPYARSPGWDGAVPVGLQPLPCPSHAKNCRLLPSLVCDLYHVRMWWLCAGCTREPGGLGAVGIPAGLQSGGFAVRPSWGDWPGGSGYQCCNGRGTPQVRVCEACQAPLTPTTAILVSMDGNDLNL